MKTTLLRQVLSALLCAILLLSLAACGEKAPTPPKDEVSTAGGKTGLQEDSDPETTSEEGAESLAWLRSDMTDSSQTTGGVIYLGHRDQGDTVPLSNWMKTHWTGLVDTLPFMLEISRQRVLGPGYGDLYCLVPRDGDTSLTVEQVTWKGTADQPVVGETIYQGKGKPVLLYVNSETSREKPDVQVTLVTKSGVELTWYPVIDEYETPVIPTGKGGAPMLMDFSIFGFVTGLDYPQDWSPEDESAQDGGSQDWSLQDQRSSPAQETGCWVEGWKPTAGTEWLPPTDWGLAYTTWLSGPWMMEMSWGDSGDPNYSGVVTLFYQESAGQLYELCYSGVWRMEGNRLCMKFQPSSDICIQGRYPVVIDSSGENLHVEADPETYSCPPFFADDMLYRDLTLTYG